MSVKTELNALGDSVREKCGINGLLTIDQMAQAIEDYEPGGYSAGDVVLGKCNVTSGYIETVMKKLDPEDPHTFICYTGGVDVTVPEQSDFYSLYSSLVDGGWVFENLTVTPITGLYDERTYIGSTSSSQYFHVGLKSNANLKHQLKYAVTSRNGGCLYGSRPHGGDYRMFYAGTSFYWDIGATDMQYRLSFSDQTGTTQVREYELGNFYVKDLVTGNIKAGSQADVKPIGTSAGEIKVCDGSDLGRFYYIKIYDNGDLVRDFKPVTRMLDDKPGFLDLVNYAFYASEGAQDFGDIGEKTGNVY